MYLASTLGRSPAVATPVVATLLSSCLDATLPVVDNVAAAALSLVAPRTATNYLASTPGCTPALVTPVVATVLSSCLDATLPVVDNKAAAVADGPPLAEMPPSRRTAVAVALWLCCLRTLRRTTVTTWTNAASSVLAVAPLTSASSVRPHLANMHAGRMHSTCVLLCAMP